MSHRPSGGQLSATARTPSIHLLALAVASLVAVLTAGLAPALAGASPLRATSFVRGKPGIANLYPGATRVIAGDFNDDGIDDVLYGNVTEGSLVYGTSPTQDLDLAADLGSKGVRFQTPPRADLALNDIKDVDPAGDFDGDGVDDVLVSTDLVVYVVYGAPGTTGTVQLTAGSRVTAVTTKAGVDNDVAGIGDFNGDGYDDIAVQRATTGAAVVYGGARTTTIDANNRGTRTSLIQATSRCTIILFIRKCAQIGVDFEPVGDFDGDGRTDLAIENNEKDGNYVLYGRTDIFQISPVAQTGLTRLPVSTGQVAQTVGDITRAGDVNGDGLDDVVSWGSVLIFGRTSRPSSITSFDPSLTISSSVTNGLTVEAVGDQNGDGRDDLAVFTYNDIPSQVRVVTAIPTNAPGTINVDAGAQVEGLPAQVAASIEGGGDLDGDGLGDLVVGTSGDGESAYLVSHGTGTPGGGGGGTQRPATLVAGGSAFDAAGNFILDATLRIRWTCDGVSHASVPVPTGNNAVELGLYEEGDACTVIPEWTIPTTGAYANCVWKDESTLRGSIPLAADQSFLLTAGTNGWSVRRTCELPATDYPSGLEVPGWTYSGSAYQNSYLLELNGLAANQVGSAMWASALDYRNKTLEFDVRIAGGTGQAEGLTLAFVRPGADGQPSGGRIGSGGPLLGFGGLSGVAVALDQKKDVGDPTGNFIGFTDGAIGSRLNWLATGDPGLRLRDPTPRSIKVVNSGGTTTVFVNGRQRMRSALPIPPTAFLAFTGATGGVYQLHSISFLKITNS